MHIAKPVLVDRGDFVALVANVTHHGRTHPVWFAVPREWAHHLDPECLDPFVIGALPTALRTGDSIYAAGRVSARLLFALNTSVPALLAQTGSDFRRIQVRVAMAVDYPSPPPYSRAVATGFAGGIDAFAVLHDHLGSAVPPAHRLTHLVCSNVGAFGPAGREAFGRRLAAVHAAAQELHLPLIAVDSNLDEFNGLDSFAHDQQFRNVAAAIILQPLVGTYLYASAFRYEHCFVRGPDAALSAWEPVLIPHLSSERLRLLSVGCQYSRVEKIERLASLPASHRHLRVCSREVAHNCSRCRKCVRTLLTLELLGRLESFAPAFDLAAYRSVRSHAIVEMLASNDPLWIELRELARARGRQFPATLRLAAALTPAASATRWEDPEEGRAPRRLTAWPTRLLHSFHHHTASPAGTASRT